MLENKIINNLEGIDELPDLDLSTIKKPKKKPRKKIDAKLLKKKIQDPVDNKIYIEPIYEELPKLDLSGPKPETNRNTVALSESDNDYDYFDLLDRIQEMLGVSGTTSDRKTVKITLPLPTLCAMVAPRQSGPIFLLCAPS